MVLAWWLDLLRAGWLGALAAMWLAATAVPVAALIFLTIVGQMKLVFRRIAPALSADVTVRRRLRSRLEESG